MKNQNIDMVVLGIDIGGTNTAFGLVDQSGQVIYNSSMPTQSEQTPEQLLGKLIAEIKTYLQNNSKYKVVGVGIGAPNGNYFSGEVVDPPNLAWPTTNLVNLVQKYFDTKVSVTNDANAAALGEMQFGAARGMKNFIVITLGTGLGSGIVLDGALVYGSDGHAGEMGHITTVPEGRLCNCGRKGCLETYASAEGIRRTVQELLTDGSRSSILKESHNGPLNGKTIAEAAASGDEVALEAFRITADILGRSLVDAVTLLSPEAIIVFGGLAQAGDVLMNPLRESFETALLPIHKGKVQLLQSGLEAGNAAILGAAALIWNEL